jgi:hypothetical protein
MNFPDLQALYCSNEKLTASILKPYVKNLIKLQIFNGKNAPFF